MAPLISTLASISASGYRFPLSSALATPTISKSWIARIGRFVSNTNNIAQNILVTSTGEFYICGINRVTYSATGISFAISKYSSSGVIIWQKIFDTFNTTVKVASMCVDSSGNLFFVGQANYTANKPTGYTTQSAIDGYFGKLNSTNGDTIFLKRINFNLPATIIGDDFLEGIAYSQIDNTIVVTGRTGRLTSSTAGTRDSCLIAKYNNDTGALVWQQIYYYQTEPTVAIYGYDVTIDTSGKIYIAAYTLAGNAGNTLIALNSSGQLLWANRIKYGDLSSSTLIPYRVITTSNYIVVASFGAARPTGSTLSKFMLTLTGYSLSGTGAIWQTRPEAVPNGFTAGLGPSGSGDFVAMTKDSSNNIYVAFQGVANYKVSPSQSNPDCILLYKFNETGNIVWMRAISLIAALTGASSYDGNPYTRPTGLDCLGNYLYLVGYTNATLSSQNSSFTYVFLKIPTDGSMLSTTGFKFNSQMSYKITDAASSYGFLNYTPSSEIVTSSLSNNNYSYQYNTSVEVAIPSTDNNMVIEFAVL